MLKVLMNSKIHFFLLKNPYFTKSFFSKNIPEKKILSSLPNILSSGKYQNLLYQEYDFKEEGIYKIDNSDNYLQIVCIIVKKNFNLKKLPIFKIQAFNIIDHTNEIFLEKQKKNHYKNVVFENILTTMIDTQTYFTGRSKIGNGVSIYNSTIEDNVIVEPFSVIKNSTIKKGTLVKSFSVIEDSIIKKECILGPSCYIRNSSIGTHSIIGFCVEISHSEIQDHNKIKHLTYIGSTSMGSNNNIGAGTITCNFDGTKKNKTIIDNNVFIGANTNLIAPIRLHDNSFTGAGSTLTKNIPKNTLSLTRSEEVHKKRKNNVRNRRLQK